MNKLEGTLHLGMCNTSPLCIYSFSGTTNFINNSADHAGFGGAIYTLDNTVLSLSGTNNFINNYAGIVLAVWAWFSGGVYRNWCLDVLEG